MNYSIKAFLLLIIALPAFAANTFTIKQESSATPIQVGGAVIAKQQATLTAQAQGSVKQIFGQEGGRFKKGVILIQLDKSELLANRGATLSNVHNAQAQYQRELSSPSSNITPSGMGLPFILDSMVANPMQFMIGTRNTSTERRVDLISKQAQIQGANSKLKQLNARIRDRLTVALSLPYWSFH